MSDTTWNSDQSNVFAIGAKRRPGLIRPKTDITTDVRVLGDANLKRLREVAPFGTKGKPRLIGAGELNPLASFIFEVRTWLGIPERGMSDAERTAVLKNVVATAVVSALFLCVFTAVTNQTMHARTASAVVHTESAEEILAVQAAVGTNAPVVLASEAVPLTTNEDEGYDTPVPIESIPIP